ncbi:MAG: glycosyltransferase family 2 protein [Gammaproteobacteria bacterium]|nr:glycosyltransferase family 2 protein [Gammaproteobacteria bacterium]
MLSDITDILTHIDWKSFLYFCWFFVLFDVPRYFLGLTAIALSLLFGRRTPEPTLDCPVSLILAGHNDADGLQRSVLSIREQTQKGIEIIVIDDGSTDDTLKIARQLQQDGLITHALSSGVRGGKTSALNLGLQYCSHDIVITADMDTSFDRDAIEKLVAGFSDPALGATSGNVAVRNPDANLLTTMQSLEYFMSISAGRRFTSTMGILTIISGAFGAFRKSALRSVGGWEVGPGEDGSVTNKLRRAGWRIGFAPHAWAYTNVPEEIGNYIHQRMRWNRSVIRDKVRRFRSAFNPFSQQFSLLDVIALTNNIFFQVLLSTSFFIYLTWLFYQLGSGALLFISLITFVYYIESMLSFAIVYLMYRERISLSLGIYIFAFTLFESFITRAIRMLSYLDELIFRRSYRDSFVPVKVRNVLKRF